MFSADSFTDFIQARDAAGLQVYMTNERNFPVAFRERNNRALFEACRDGAEKLCEVLISFGADVNTPYHQYPLFIACENVHVACVDLLLAHGANVNAGDLVNNRTPLMATADEDVIPDGQSSDQFIDNRCRCMRSLLAAGAAINLTDNEGWTALSNATWNFQLTEILVNAGADMQLNIFKTSVLHKACGQNKVDVVDLLLERGADIDSVNWRGWASLHGACLNLHQNVVFSLLRNGADTDIVNNGGCTALQYAMSRDKSSDRVTVLQMIAACAHSRLEASSSEWIRLARHEQHLVVRK